MAHSQRGVDFLTPLPHPNPLPLGEGEACVAAMPNRIAPNGRSAGKASAVSKIYKASLAVPSPSRERVRVRGSRAWYTTIARLIPQCGTLLTRPSPTPVVLQDGYEHKRHDPGSRLGRAHRPGGGCGVEGA